MTHRSHTRARRTAVLFTAGFVFAVGACGRQAAEASDLVMGMRDSATVRIVELRDHTTAPLPAWRLAPDPAVVIGEPSGGSGHDLFGAVDAARFSHGGIAVANSGTLEVRIYDSAGSHVRTLGGRGEGPGEFRSLAWIGVAAADTLVAYDMFQRRATWLAPDGRVARTVTVVPTPRGDPQPLGFARGSLLMRSGFDRVFGKGERRDTVQVYLYAEDGAIVDSLGTYPGTERFFYTAPDRSASMQMPPIYGRTVHAHVADGRLAIGASDDLSIDVFDEALLSLRIRGRAPLRPARPEDVDRERRNRLGTLSGPMQQLRQRAIAATPVRETLPAFGSLRVDADRWIWVQDPLRFSDDAARWTVLDPGGIPRAFVETPQGLEVYEIGREYVLGRQRDADGVERIVLHRLQRD